MSIRSKAYRYTVHYIHNNPTLASRLYQDLSARYLAANNFSSKAEALEFAKLNSGVVTEFDTGRVIRGSISRS